MTEHASEDSEVAAGLSRYSILWKLTPLRRCFVGTVIGRLAQTMAPLAMLLVFHQHSGTFATAGLAVAVYGFAAVPGTPFVARLVDRRGPAVLVLASLVSSAGYLLVALSPDLSVAFCGSVIAGASTPPLTPALRTSIMQCLNREVDRNAALSLDSVLAEMLFVVGPAAVGVATALAHPIFALYGCAVLVTAGAGVVSTARLSPRAATADAPLPRVRFGLPKQCLVWIIVAALQMTAIGLVEVAVTARTVQLGAASAAGGLLAVWAGGSVCGGLIYGARNWRSQTSARLLILLVLVAAGFALLLAARSLGLLFPAMFFAGWAIAPAATALVSMMGAVTPPNRHAEGFAWLASANNLGGSAGYAVAGIVVSHANIDAALLGAVALPCLGCMLIATSIHGINRLIGHSSAVAPQPPLV